mmetsp:Transcript_85930/g.119278  ORF Transcript_85930/g.119278 Transcript_85930/m.119278 type:complete len:137 (-) Transcript_85930:156-566(-)
MLDLLTINCTRVGHGFNLAKHPYLYDTYKERNICLEVCPISNHLLKYMKDLRTHPAIGIYNYGIKISLNNDDPGIFNTDIIWDYVAAAVSFQFDLLDLKKIIYNSLECCCYKDDRRKKLTEEWEKRWANFITEFLK